MMLKWLLAFCFISQSLVASNLDQANESYRLGLQAKTVLEREENFNQALKLYSEIEQTHFYPSSQLDQAIGNTYFQFKNYPWAIIYYFKALKIDPRNQKSLELLQLAQENLGLAKEERFRTVWDYLHFENWISLAEQNVFLFYFLLLNLLVISIYIWKKSIVLKKIILIISIISLLLFFNIVIKFYFSPIEGVLVAATGFYRGPDLQQSQLMTQPLKMGTKMVVLDIEPDGYWLKIEDSDGLIGYIPASAIRII